MGECGVDYIWRGRKREICNLILFEVKEFSRNQSWRWIMGKSVGGFLWKTFSATLKDNWGKTFGQRPLWFVNDIEEEDSLSASAHNWSLVFSNKRKQKRNFCPTSLSEELSNSDYVSSRVRGRKSWERNRFLPEEETRGDKRGVKTKAANRLCIKRHKNWLWVEVSTPHWILRLIKIKMTAAEGERGEKPW